MARKPRLDAPGCLHHAMARGNGGQRVFLDDLDRIAFLEILSDGVARFGHALYAFCVMDNHFHLALRTAEVSISRVMQNLVLRYTRHFNRRYHRTGHLFQGRFKSVVVDEESYLLELVRYIHLNPERARIVKDPAEWPWSGHRAYLGKESLPFLNAEWVLRRFAPEPAKARKAYERFVLQGLAEERRPESYTGDAESGIAGEKPFTCKTLLVAGRTAPKPSLDALVARACEALGLEEEDLAAPSRGRREARARGIVGLLAQDTGASSLTEVGRRFGRDVAATSLAVARVRASLKSDGELAALVAGLKARIAEAQSSDS